jgi:2Fe-2S ferredoxin
MGGSNPYIQYPQIKKPQRKFKVKFVPMNIEIEVDPDKLPFGDTGLPGSLLDIAMAHGIEIDHACGGVCACSTCHVIVRKGGSSCNEAEDFELDMVENAPGNTVESRLSCQAVPDGSCDLEVEIPGWNRNLAKEGPH